MLFLFQHFSKKKKRITSFNASFSYCTNFAGHPESRYMYDKVILGTRESWAPVYCLLANLESSENNPNFYFRSWVVMAIKSNFRNRGISLDRTAGFHNINNVHWLHVKWDEETNWVLDHLTVSCSISQDAWFSPFVSLGKKKKIE